MLANDQRMIKSNSLLSDWSELDIKHDNDSLALSELSTHDSARRIALEDTFEMLACPDTRSPLRLLGGGSLAFPDGEPVEMRGARPTLLPAFARRRIVEGQYAFNPDTASQPNVQYLYISDIKAHGGDQNLSSDNIWVQRHVFRTRRLTGEASGSLLDIGCDTPAVSSYLFPASVNYVGLEPSLTISEQFCICGMAEFLPFRDECFDNVALLTSLDHILDAHQAMDQAFRVLRPGGSLYIASLVWLRDASLLGDTVHFHHFRDWEIQGLMRKFNIENVHRYSWKGDEHRYGIYLKARKPLAVR
jgi:SAM-dependent methyltransferase